MGRLVLCVHALLVVLCVHGADGSVSQLNLKGLIIFLYSFINMLNSADATDTDSVVVVFGSG